MKRYLKAKDIQERLQVSRSRAYELMDEMTGLRVGRARRVSEEAFERWVKAHEEAACEGSTGSGSAGRSTGARTTSANDASGSPPAAPRSKVRRRTSPMPNDELVVRAVYPRTRRTA